MKHFYTYCIHDLVAEGASVKTHLTRGNAVAALCGYANAKFGATTIMVDEDWLYQPDPEGELCKICKASALRSFCFKEITILP